MPKKYTNQDRRRAAIAIQVNGGSIAASAACGIPARTIRKWTNMDWWPAVMEQSRDLAQQEMVADFRRVSAKALAQAEDRIDNGDEVIVGRERMRRKMSGRDLAVVSGVFTDKALVLEGRPNSITQVSHDVSDLAQALVLIARERREHDGLVIEGEVYEVSEDAALPGPSTS